MRSKFPNTFEKHVFTINPHKLNVHTIIYSIINRLPIVFISAMPTLSKMQDDKSLNSMNMKPASLSYHCLHTEYNIGLRDTINTKNQ